jgi:phosphoglucomutase/phosphomannomutase
MGAAAPQTADLSGAWETMDGNQLGVLLADFVLRQLKQTGRLTSRSYVVTTLVTTLMIKKIAEAHGARCFHENLVGFKWICKLMDELGASDFVFGAEESHGYLVGQYCRDKDGAVACMLMCELAAWVKSQGKSLLQHLDELYAEHGLYTERLTTIKMEGSDGMQRMESLMGAFRTAPPKSLGPLRIASLRDYSSGQRVYPNGRTEKITGPNDNLIFLETDRPGNYVAARPSGTEPKVKFYMFGFVSSDEVASNGLDPCKVTLSNRLSGFADDLRQFADRV